MPGMGELIMVLLVVMLIFGANKLPQVGHGLGAAIQSFRRAVSGAESEPATAEPTERRLTDADVSVTVRSRT